jgi:hypothetical protein
MGEEEVIMAPDEYVTRHSGYANLLQMGSEEEPAKVVPGPSSSMRYDEEDVSSSSVKGCENSAGRCFQYQTHHSMSASRMG